MKKTTILTLLLLIIVWAIAGCSDALPTTTSDGQANSTESEEQSSGETGQEETDQESAAPAEPLNTENLLTNLSKLVLRPADLPNEYRALSGEEIHATNLYLVQTMGELPAKRYINATGRLDGWSLSLERVNKADIVPGNIQSSIEVFPTVEGAQTALTPDWYKAYQDEENKPEFVEGVCNLGDKCLLYFYETKDPASDLVTIRYEVAFAYKNVVVWVMARGLDIDIKQGYLLDAGAKILAKLEAAP